MKLRTMRQIELNIKREREFKSKITTLMLEGERLFGVESEFIGKITEISDRIREVKNSIETIQKTLREGCDEGLLVCSLYPISNQKLRPSPAAKCGG